MIFRPSRAPRDGRDIWLPLKAALFIAGAAFGTAGMWLKRDWLVTVAIVLLFAGVLLRFAGPREKPPE